MTDPEDPTTLPNRTAMKRVPATLQGVQEQFRHPFARPHDVRRPYSLVRGNEDEPFRLMPAGHFHDDTTADDVVEHRLPGILFEHGNMFVRRSMKNDLGTVRLKDRCHQCFILDPAQYRPASIAAELIVKLHLDVKQVCLVGIHENQHPRSEANDLPAQLGPDRSSATADQDDFTVEIPPDFPHVELNGRAPQEIFIIDIPQGLDADPPIDDLSYSRQGLVGDPTGLADIDDPAYLIPRGGWDGNQDLFDLFVFDDPGKLIQRTQNRYAVDRAPVFFRIVVDETDDADRGDGRFR